MTRLLRYGFGLSALACLAAVEAGSAPAPTPAVVKDEKNGVKRPAADSVTGKLWLIADRISGELKAPAPRAAVVKAYMAEVPAANEATANTQYARWVTYNGAADVLRASRKAETEQKAAAAQKVKDDAKAAKDAEKLKKAADAKAAKDAKEKERADKAKAREDEKAKKAKDKADAELVAKQAAEKTAKEAAKLPAPVKSAPEDIAKRREEKKAAAGK